MHTKITCFYLAAAMTCVASMAQAATPIVKITPHRAVYEMSLAQNRHPGQVINAEGTMTYTWGDACDGWTNEQKLEMKYYYVQGQVVQSTISNASWEAKDGSRYTFTAHNGSDAHESSTFRGEATLDATGGKVVYSQPKGKKDAILKSGTLFPNHHTVLILEAAEQGNKVPNKIVFDGSDETGQSEISVFVGKPAALAKDQNFDIKLATNPLVQGDTWPVRMAFYPMKADDAGMPDYEMTMDMLPNGVARSMLVDYGDFSVRGVLTTIETLPANGC